jgi:hypothetical protein
LRCYLRSLHGGAGLSTDAICLPGPLRPKKPEEPVIQSIIFGFGHRARSGKDTAVAEIMKQCKPRYDVRRYAFADELKREVTQAALSAGGMLNLWNRPTYFLQENESLIELPSWVCYEQNADMTDPLCPLGKQRTLLQWWGTEFRRNVNPNYWVTRLAKRIAEEKPEIALIADMRFQNEKAFVEKYGQSVRVDRADLPSLRGAAGVHPSELALADVPDWDWGLVLKNNSTLEDFLKKSVEAFDELMMLQAAS